MNDSIIYNDTKYIFRQYLKSLNIFPQGQRSEECDLIRSIYKFNLKSPVMGDFGKKKCLTPFSWEAFWQGHEKVDSYFEK